MSSSSFASNSMVLATAVAVVSGTVLLLAFRLQKPPNNASIVEAGAKKFDSINHPRSCIYIDGKKRLKKKKKVHFAEDVLEPSSNGEEFRKRLESKSFQKLGTSSLFFKDKGGKKKINMPANRIALYTGIIRDRCVHRFSCS